MQGKKKRKTVGSDLTSVKEEKKIVEAFVPARKHQSFRVKQSYVKNRTKLDTQENRERTNSLLDAVNRYMCEKKEKRRTRQRPPRGSNIYFHQSNEEEDKAARGWRELRLSTCGAPLHSSDTLVRSSPVFLRCSTSSGLGERWRLWVVLLLAELLAVELLAFFRLFLRFVAMILKPYLDLVETSERFHSECKQNGCQQTCVGVN